MDITALLDERGVRYEKIEHRATYGAQRLAHELHIPGREVAKTVLLRANHGYEYLLAILPAEREIDFEKLSKALGGSKLELATEIEIAERFPDCEIGALPPFGSQYNTQSVMDESLLSDEQIVFEGTSHKEAIRMKTSDYLKVEEPLIIPFAKEWASSSTN